MQIHFHRRVLTVLALASLAPPARLIHAQTKQGNEAVMQLLTEGRSAMQRGDLPAAEGLFRQATAAAPELASAFLGLGLVQFREGSFDGAILSLRKAADLSPQLQGPHLYLGIAQYQTGQSEAAVVSLAAELALNPDNPEALTWMGIAEMGIGQPLGAVEPLDRLARLKPDDPQVLYYQARAHAQAAEVALARLYAADPDSALVHRALAENLASSGQPEKSIGEYQLALKKQPGNPDLLEALGDEDQKISRFDEAQSAYRRELELNPRSAVALYNLGKIDVERGEPLRGVDLLRRAEAAHASPAPTDYYLGLGLVELGQNAEAAQWLERSLANKPSAFIEQGAWYQLARVYQKLDRKTDAQNALAHLKQLKDTQQRQPMTASPDGPAPGRNTSPAPNQP